MEKRSLLIVDDEENIRRAMIRSLRADGYDFVAAGSGQEALEVLRQRPVDMVITDHSMPGMSGLELVREIKKQWPNTMRLILTGYADLEMAIQAINEGEVHRFLRKPLEPEDLKLMVRDGFSRLALERENRRLLATVKRQSDVLAALEEQHPGISEVERGEDGSVILEDDEILRMFAATLGVQPGHGA